MDKESCKVIFETMRGLELDRHFSSMKDREVAMFLAWYRLTYAKQGEVLWSALSAAIQRLARAEGGKMEEGQWRLALDVVDEAME